MFRNLKNHFKIVSALPLVLLTTFFIKPDTAVAATFGGALGPDDIRSNYQFTFINHSNRPIQYDLGPATGGQHNEINGKVNPGEKVETKYIDVGGTLEQGNVPVVTISNAPTPGFRFSSDSSNQHIDILAGDGYTVTRKTSEISEVTGNGFRVTVDGGGENDPRVSNIYIQVYND